MLSFVYQVIRKGEVSCCWICTDCKDNEYVQDEFTCKACDLGWWPDKELEGWLTCLLSYTLLTFVNVDIFYLYVEILNMIILMSCVFTTS